MASDHIWFLINCNGEQDSRDLGVKNGFAMHTDKSFTFSLFYIQRHNKRGQWEISFHINLPDPYPAPPAIEREPSQDSKHVHFMNILLHFIAAVKAVAHASHTQPR